MRKFKFPVFWCIYLVLVIAAVVAINYAMTYVTDFLSAYEASQPKNYAEQVFEENFAEFDAVTYLEKFDDDVFGRETRENVAAYLSEKIKDAELSYYSVSSKDEGTYKYSVKAGKVKIAGFTLYEEKVADGFPTYRADDFEVYFAANEDVTVTVPKGATVSVNGFVLDESHIIEDDIADKHNERLPEGVPGKYYTTYKADGFVTVPKVEAKLGELELSVIEGENGFETAPVYNDELKSAHIEYVIAAIENYATYIQGRYSNGGVTLGMVLKYFDPASAVYKSVKSVANQYVNSYDSYEFKNEAAEEFIQYDENTFSCRVSFTQVLHLGGAQDYTDSIDYTLYLRRVGNKFLIFDMDHE